MAFKTFGGPFFNRRIFAQIKIANGLWIYSRRDKTHESAVPLFFLGWFEREEHLPRLYTITLLFITINIGIRLD